MESIAKFMLYSLKQIPQEIINNVNNQEPDPCYACNGPILQQVFNKNLTLILLPCGHIHHDRCIKALQNGSRCPFPYCTEIVESNVPTFSNMQNMQTMQMQQTIQNINIQNIHPKQVIQQQLDPQTLKKNRELNSRLILGHESINIVPNEHNQYPQNFPTSISQLRKLNGSSADTFLEFYGLKKTGLVKEKRDRLAEHLGIKYLNDY